MERLRTHIEKWSGTSLEYPTCQSGMGLKWESEMGPDHPPAPRTIRIGPREEFDSVHLQEASLAASPVPRDFPTVQRASTPLDLHQRRRVHTHTRPSRRRSAAKREGHKGQEEVTAFLVHHSPRACPRRSRMAGCSGAIACRATTAPPPSKTLYGAACANMKTNLAPVMSSAHTHIHTHTHDPTLSKRIASTRLAATVITEKGPRSLECR